MEILVLGIDFCTYKTDLIHESWERFVTTTTKIANTTKHTTGSEDYSQCHYKHVYTECLSKVA